MRRIYPHPFFFFLFPYQLSHFPDSQFWIEFELWFFWLCFSEHFSGKYCRFKILAMVYRRENNGTKYFSVNAYSVTWCMKNIPQFTNREILNKSILLLNSVLGNYSLVLSKNHDMDVYNNKMPNFFQTKLFIQHLMQVYVTYFAVFFFLTLITTRILVTFKILCW